MRYALLKYKAEDKAYMPITSDSAILSILQYYERTQEEWLPEAYYYAGRTYTELGDSPRALDYFQQAATLMEKDARWNFVLARIYSNMATLFSTHKLVNESIPYYHKARTLFLQLQDSSSLVNIYTSIAGEYRHENWDSAAYYYDLATSIASALNDTVWYLNLIKDKAGAFVILGKFEDARMLISEYNNAPISLKSGDIYSVTARLYDSLQIEDSLEYYLYKMIGNGNFYAQLKASGRLAELYTKQRKNNLAASFMAQYQALLDSADLFHNSQMLLDMQSTYNYDKYAQDAAEMAQVVNRERTKNLIFLLFIVVFIVLCGVLSIYLNRKKKNETTLIKEIDSIKRGQMINTSKLESERAKFAQTEVYKRIKDSQEIKETDMRAIETFYLENNPEFLHSLKSMCSFSDDEWCISLLIRAGFMQKDIAKIILRTEGAVHHARKRLLARISREDAKAQEWNRIIESL